MYQFPVIMIVVEEQPVFLTVLTVVCRGGNTSFSLLCLEGWELKNYTDIRQINSGKHLNLFNIFMCTQQSSEGKLRSTEDIRPRHLYAFLHQE